jgi:hypothetical protein
LLNGPGVQSDNRFEQPLAVAEVQPKLLQIGIGEFAQDVARDAVLGERIRIVAKALFREPARDVDHSALPVGGRVAQLADCDRRLASA